MDSVFILKIICKYSQWTSTRDRIQSHTAFAGWCVRSDCVAIGLRLLWEPEIGLVNLRQLGHDLKPGNEAKVRYDKRFQSSCIGSPSSPIYGTPKPGRVISSMYSLAGWAGVWHSFKLHHSRVLQTQYGQVEHRSSASRVLAGRQRWHVEDNKLLDLRVRWHLTQCTLQPLNISG